MTANEGLRGELAAHRMLAIVRGLDPAACLRSLETLAGCGIRMAEVSLTSDGATGVISRAVTEFGAVMRVGAGTVMTADDARAAAQAGATFVVSPGMGEGIDTAVSLGMPILPGAMTPTEISAAWRAGAAAVKLFPASIGGPAYLRSLREPLPDIDIVPVGGVRIEESEAWLSAGALALGVGSPLLGDAPSGGSQAELAARARMWVEALAPHLPSPGAGAGA